jgi:ADP-heptose:LPS heptosyltransferase
MASRDLSIGVGRSRTFLVGTDGGPKHFANAAGIPTVVVMDGLSAVGWTPRNRQDQRVLRPRVEVPQDHVCGTVLDVKSLAEISVDAVWEQIEELARRKLIRFAACQEQVA